MCFSLLKEVEGCRWSVAWESMISAGCYRPVSLPLLLLALTLLFRQSIPLVSLDGDQSLGARHLHSGIGMNFRRKGLPRMQL
jgi:hypothetical protein